MKKNGIIMGGMGPAASLKFNEYVVEIASETCKTDQEHPSIAHLSFPNEIPDRTKFLLENKSDNPGKEAGNIISSYVIGMQQIYEEFIVAVTCNTFHTDKIFDPFQKSIRKRHDNVQVLNMIEVARDTIVSQSKNIKKVGLLSTTGTRELGTYHHIFGESDIEIIEVPYDLQPSVHDAIYNPSWGIKSCSGTSDKLVSIFESFLQILSEEVDIVILGCTEIPLVFPGKNTVQGVELFDPMYSLAKKFTLEVLNKDSGI